MKSFNAICGIPRSGSTLICNILNQHSEVFCSSTSPLSAVVAAAVHQFSALEETKSLLINDKSGTEARISGVAKGMVGAWYASQEEHVFDKSRGWATNMEVLRHTHPRSVVIVTVRDPRDVIASVHMQHSKMPLLDMASTPLGKTLLAKSDELMSPDGMVGSAILGVEDMLRRGGGGENTIFVKYEHFVNAPGVVLEGVLARLGLEKDFKFELENIENTATDVDGIYLNKFPHKGCGKLNASRVGVWPTYLDGELAEAIRARYPFYCKAFGY